MSDLRVDRVTSSSYVPNVHLMKDVYKEVKKENNQPLIDDVDMYTIGKILCSSQLTDSEKAKFLQKHQGQIKETLRGNISAKEFDYLITHRPLMLFKPIKNSFTKRGDKLLLAKTLGISHTQVESYINNSILELEKSGDINSFPKDLFNTIKTYVYRHGSKDQVTYFFGAELARSNDIGKTLNTNLEYHNGGIADYYVRPIHRMDNKTMIRLFMTVSDGLKQASESGKITPNEEQDLLGYAFQRIYILQQNSKLKNAIKNVHELKSKQA